MRISREKAESNKAEVIAQASRLFREHGLGGPSVTEVMRAAGMTHGGFYNHFSSKTDLQASALSHNFDKAVSRLAAIDLETQADADAQSQMNALEVYISSYLSPRARDSGGASCPMVAFGADVSREGDEVRRAYADGLERYLTHLAQIIGQTAPGRKDDAPAAPILASEGHESAANEPAATEARREAIALLSTLVGGLSLARSVAAVNPQLSDELLVAARGQALQLTRLIFQN